MDIFEACVYYHGLSSNLISDLALMQEREKRFAVEYNSLKKCDPLSETTKAILITASERYKGLYETQVSWKNWRTCFAARKAGIKKWSIKRDVVAYCVLRLRPAVRKRLMKSMISSPPLFNVPKAIVLNGIEALGLNGRVSDGTVGVRVSYTDQGLDPLPPPFTKDLQSTRAMRFCFRHDGGRWVEVFKKKGSTHKKVAEMVSGTDKPRIWRQLYVPT